MGRCVCFQRHMDDYQTHETMFYFTNLQKNANQIQGDTSLLSEWQTKRQQATILGEKVEKRNSHAPLAACKHNGKQYEGSSKFKNEQLHSPATPLLSIYLKETKSPIQKYIHTLKFTAALFIMAKLCMPKDLMI